MTEIVSKPDWGSQLILSDGTPAQVFQTFFDDVERFLNSGQLVPLTIANLPLASNAGLMVFVTDESGGPVPAYSDGTNWRRVSDGAIVS